MSARLTKAGLIMAACAAMIPAGAEAQVERQVEAVEDGEVRLHFAARPGVEICDEGVRIGESRMHWNFRDGYDRESNCRSDVVDVMLRVRDGVVRKIELSDARQRADGSIEDLGRFDPEESAEWLVGLAYRGATSDAAEDAIFIAMLADAPDSWREVLTLAKDGGVHDGVRKNALFWLGQAAASAATDGLSEVATDRSEDQEIRDAAVFALSQRPERESIPILMELARTAEEAETRKSAMFWLAQSEDPRVVAFFEEILLRGTR